MFSDSILWDFPGRALGRGFGGLAGACKQSVDTGRETERETESKSVESCFRHTHTDWRVLLVVVKTFADEKLPVTEAQL